MVKQSKEFRQLFGALISEARKRKGFSQGQVANMLSISRTQIVNIEKGTSGTTPEIILKLAIIYECPIGDLFPSPDKYKPKIKIPPPKKTRPGRKERGPNTSRPTYLVLKENEELKKQIEQLNKQQSNEQ